MTRGRANGKFSRHRPMDHITWMASVRVEQQQQALQELMQHGNGSGGDSGPTSRFGSISRATSIDASREGGKKDRSGSRVREGPDVIRDLAAESVTFFFSSGF